MNYKLLYLGIFFFLISFTSVSASLIAYYDFDTDFTDKVNSYDLTNTGVSINQSYVNYGALFNLSESDNLEQATLLETGSSAFGISTWFYLTETNPSQQSNIFSKTVTGGTYYFECYVLQGNYNVSCSIRDGGGATVSIGTEIDNLGFHHLVYTGDTSNVYLYLDGVLVNQSSNTHGVNSQTKDFAIGWRGDGLTYGYWNGIIDEFKVYDSLLTQQDVNKDYYLDNFITVRLYDARDNSTINNFNSSIYYPNGTLFLSNTTSSGIAKFNLTNEILGNYTVFTYIDGFKDQNITLEYLNNSIQHNFYTYPAPTINLTFYDEITRLAINNVDYELIFDNSAITGSTSNGHQYFELNNTGDLEIVYNSDGYFQRKYFINVSTETEGEVALYLINQSADNVGEISYLVTDQAGVNLDGARISVLRRYVINNNAVFETVEMSESNVAGEGFFHLEKINPDYKFLVTYEGKTVLITSGEPISKNSIILKANTRTSPTEIIYDIQGLYTNITYSNYTYSFTWIDSNNVMDNICLNVYRYLSTGKTLTNSSCSSSSVGTISLGIGGTSGSYEAVATGVYNSYSYVLDNDFKKLDGISSSMSLEGLFWVLILVVVAATIGSYNPIVSIVFSVAALAIASVLGILSISQGALTFIGSIAGFIIYAFRRSGA